MPRHELERVPALPKAPGRITEPSDHAGGGDAIGLVVVHDQDQGTGAKRGKIGNVAVGHGASGCRIR
jgi:hypothetical protein